MPPKKSKAPEIDLASNTGSKVWLTPDKFHQGQWKAWESTSTVTVITAGTGGGKTSFSFEWLHREMAKAPGRGHAYGLPNDKMINSILLTAADPKRPTLMQYLESKDLHPVLHKTDSYIETDLGTIYFMTWESWANAAGLHLASFVIDEFDEMPGPELYHIAQERTGASDGRVLLVGTPRNVRWFNEEILPFVEAGDRHFLTLVQFSSIDNPTYSKKFFERRKKQLPQWQFEREYLGLLSAKTGAGLFHPEWFIQLPPMAMPTKFEEIIQVWDTAFTVKRASDYSVCMTFGLHQNRVYLLDICRDKWEIDALLATAESQWLKWLPTKIRVEHKGSGISLFQALRSRSRPVVAYTPLTDKVARASAILDVLSTHFVFLPQDAPWLKPLMDELMAFSAISTTHDDQIDSLTMGLDYFRARVLRGGAPVVYGESKQSTWTGKGGGSGDMVFDPTTYGGWKTKDGQNAYIAKKQIHSGGSNKVITERRKSRWP